LVRLQAAPNRVESQPPLDPATGDGHSDDEPDSVGDLTFVGDSGGGLGDPAPIPSSRSRAPSLDNDRDGDIDEVGPIVTTSNVPAPVGMVGLIGDSDEDYVEQRETPWWRRGIPMFPMAAGGALLLIVAIAGVFAVLPDGDDPAASGGCPDALLAPAVDELTLMARQVPTETPTPCPATPTPSPPSRRQSLYPRLRGRPFPRTHPYHHPRSPLAQQAQRLRTLGEARRGGPRLLMRRTRPRPPRRRQPPQLQPRRPCPRPRRRPSRVRPRRRSQPARLRPSAPPSAALSQ